MNTRRQLPVPLLQATQATPALAKLMELSQDSSARLRAIESLIPSSLRPCVQAGPIDGGNWCLILDNNAVAAKIRQLLPALESHLRVKGWEINSIRLKVQISRSQ
ncbi:hypothetical protein [Rhodoferax sp.]|uniref:hypothetical protein n=1 Tax=Rhodoferax sp. TaxID=50421 RepID=UPI00275A69C9|nr:hypothetical protein [Rhodoferax sp.]